MYANIYIQHNSSKTHNPSSPIMNHDVPLRPRHQRHDLRHLDGRGRGAVQRTESAGSLRGALRQCGAPGLLATRQMPSATLDWDGFLTVGWGGTEVRTGLR